MKNSETILMNVHERVLSALNHEEADRIPTFAQSIERPFKIKMRNMLKWSEKIREKWDPYYNLIIAKHLGLDSIWIHRSNFKAPWRDKPEVPDEIKKKYNLGYINNLAHTSKKNKDGDRWYHDGALKTPELLRDWITYIKSFEPQDESYYKKFARIREKWIERGTLAIPTAGFVAWTTWSSIGLNKFAYMMRKHKNLVKELAKAYGKITMEMHKCLFEQGIDMVFVCDDWALKDRMIFAPHQWEELIEPVYRDIANQAHKFGAKFLVHSDGNISDVIPSIIRAGADAIEPMEWESGMRVAELKEKYGDKITLIGNVSATHILTYGTIEQTIKETKAQIIAGGPGGGYILAAGSDVLGTCKVENYLAMIQTVKKFGNYPINLEN